MATESDFNLHSDNFNADNFYANDLRQEPWTQSASAQSPIVRSLRHGLVVSCQAPVDSPLHDPAMIAALALTAVKRGAIGVRIDTPVHVQAVRQQVDVPIIGLWKQQIPGFEVYITPHYQQAKAIADAGADIIAIDATLRPRPNGETVAGLIAQIHQQLAKPVMADVDTLEAAIAAVEAGADLVGTTLYGYTAQTQQCSPPGFDLLQQMVQTLTVPVICEGGIASPNMAQRAIELGAYAVVVGTAITGIDAQVQAYCAALAAIE
jgi:N-acylglucosamine-6-phosphate 2-epimerase